MKGACSPTLRCSQINFLKLSASLPEMLSPIPEGPSCSCEDGQHNNSGIHQSSGGLCCGLCSCRLHSLAHRQILWNCNRFLSLRAMYILASLNFAADMHTRHANVWGMEPTSCGCGAAMAKLWVSVIGLAPRLPGLCLSPLSSFICWTFPLCVWHGGFAALAWSGSVCWLVGA